MLCFTDAYSRALPPVTWCCTVISRLNYWKMPRWCTP